MIRRVKNSGFALSLLMIVVFLSLTLMMSVGCEKQGETSWTIGMSQCNLGEPWRVQMNQDIKNEAEKHPEIQVIFKDAQNDSLRQRSKSS
jgi:ABC-type sugar transport system substrate-binding protein